jgi:hypothetical protein
MKTPGKSQFLKKSIRIWASLMIIYALLVTTHNGEFWPFRIYPMFSQAGQTWVRALTRDISNTPDSTMWNITENEEMLPGKPFPLKLVHTHRNDLANYIKKSGHWDQDRIQGLRSLFGKQLNSKKLLIVWVEGQAKNSPDKQHLSYDVRYIPFAFLTPDTSMMNPEHNFHTHW